MEDMLFFRKKPEPVAPAPRIDNGAKVASSHGLQRSSKWPEAEKAHLAAHPYCEACGPSMDPNIKVQVHHVIPFHYCILLGRADLETDERNLITLCETEAHAPAPNHHLIVGHAGDFQSSNLRVREDATKTFFRMDEASIKQTTQYQEEVKNRLKPFDQMTDEEKKDLRALMDQLYPLT
jgi:hypothetical protein